MRVILYLTMTFTLVLCFFDPPKLAIEPKGYRVDFHPHLEDEKFKGRVRIDIVNRGTDPVTTLELNSDDKLHIDEKEIRLIRLANADLSDEESDEDTPVSVSKIEKKNDMLIVHCSQKLHRDATYQLDISFEGKLDTDSSSPFYAGSYIDQSSEQKKWFAVFSPRSQEAHKTFPCFDKPFLKSWFEFTVAHKKEYSTLSTMPLEEQTNITKDGAWIRDRFARTPLMSLDSLGIFISDFKMPQVEYLQTDGIKIGLWGREDFVSTLKKAQQVLPSVLVSLELYLSRPFPLPQLNLIALPGFNEDKPKNSWGLQWFKESDLMNGNSYWLTHRLAKSVALQWLGHLASPKNESILTFGLSNFLATLVTKQLEPTVYNWNLASFHTLVLELSKPWNYGLDNDQTQILMETRVSLMMQMFEGVFGASTFKQSIQNFLAKKEFKSYAEDELWQVITEQAWADKKLLPSLSLREISNQWLHKRIPLVTLTNNISSNVTMFNQEEFIDNLENNWSKVVKKGGVEKQTGWWLPLIITESSGELRILDWLKPEQHHLSFKNNSNILNINPGSIGPYLVNYDDEGWKRLTEKIKSFPCTVRAQLLHDSLTLALSGHLNTVTALELTSFLKTEQSPEVWRTFFPLAERLRKRFQGTVAAQNLDAYFKALLTPVLNALGEEDKSSWKTELRIKTKHLLCQTGFDPCVDSARSLYATWVNASHPDEGIPIASSHLCPVMAWGNYDEWEFALNRLINFPENRSRSERNFLMRTVAGCPHDTRKYETLLNVTFMDDSYNDTFSTEDEFIILTSIAGESIGYSTLFKFLKNHWKCLKERLKGNLWEYFVQSAMGNFRTEEDLLKVNDLLDEKKADFGMALNTAQDSVARVASRVKWAKETTPSVETWLNTTMEAIWSPQKFKFQDAVIMSHTRKEI